MRIIAIILNIMSKYFAAFSILALSITFSACEPDYPVQPNASVLGEGIDCGWLIKFNETPTTLPASEDNTYIAVNLEEKYQIVDLAIMATVREATNDELIICTTMGPGYVQVFIEDIF